MKEEVANLDQCTAIELREKLPAFLGFDLKRAMQENHARRIVLMIDTYEALWRDAVHDAIYNPRADKWVRTMLEKGTGVLVTIFSRDKLRWGEFEKVWENRLEQHLLGGLSEEDATRFLKTAGVRSDPICRRIVATSGGLPFYLDLAVSQFERLVANGETVTVDDFADTPAESLHRFLDHLTEGERAELLLASYPDQVSEALLDALADKFPGDVAGVNWQRFKSHSFVMLSDDGKASLHSLMREGLQALERRERSLHFRKVHLWLFERYDTEAKPPEDERDIGERHDQALILAARHLAEADEEKLISWILDSRWEKFNRAGRYLALSTALAEPVTRLDGRAYRAPARAWEIDHHLGHLYQFMGRNEDARDLFERARASYDVLKSNRDPIVYATILHAIADACRDTGRDEARRLYERALNIYQDEPGRYQRRYVKFCSASACSRPNKRELKRRDTSDRRRKLSRPLRGIGIQTMQSSCTDSPLATMSINLSQKQRRSIERPWIFTRKTLVRGIRIMAIPCFIYRCALRRATGIRPKEASRRQ